MPAWLERAAPSELGVFLGKTASPRKGALFMSHLCRCFPEVFVDPRSLAALEAVDRYEPGEADLEAYQAALHAAEVASDEAREEYNRCARQHWDASWLTASAAAAARIANEVALQGYYHSVLSDLRHAVLGRAGAGGGPRKNPVAPVMRPVFLEHFGDVRRPVAVDPAWLTSTVVSLAEGIYAERAFDRLPILADALQDAGCEVADMLEHCRGPGPHVRGCWVVDLLLGKT
jgi:hypothetical protein